MLHVFRREAGAVSLFWGSEMPYAPPESGQDYQHNDLLDPLRNLFDNTPEGRGHFAPKWSTANQPKNLMPSRFQLPRFGGTPCHIKIQQLQKK